MRCHGACVRHLVMQQSLRFRPCTCYVLSHLSSKNVVGMSLDLQVEVSNVSAFLSVSLSGCGYFCFARVMCQLLSSSTLAFVLLPQLHHAASLAFLSMKCSRHVTGPPGGGPVTLTRDWVLLHLGAATSVMPGSCASHPVMQQHSRFRSRGGGL